MNNTYNNNTYKGFTLIELLIVIVIIGILSGVAISVIDPTAQQNRARDAVTKASMNKAALATEGYLSAYGVAPSGQAFLNGLRGAVLSSGCTLTSTSCTFSLTNSPLPTTCSNDYSGDGTGVCNFYYTSVGGTSFTITAKSFGSDNTFVYDSAKGVIKTCSSAANPVCP